MLEWASILIDIRESNPLGHYHFLILGVWVFSILAVYLRGQEAKSANSPIKPTNYHYLQNAVKFTCFYWLLLSICVLLNMTEVFGLAAYAAILVFVSTCYPTLVRYFLDGLSCLTLAESKLGEIITHDVLCSFSRIPWVSMMHFYQFSGQSTLVHLLAYYFLLFPFLVRLKQCCLNGQFTLQSQLNACKYAVSILALICSTIENPILNAEPSVSADVHPVLTGWTLSLLAVSFLVNVCWDLLMDWNLVQFIQMSKGPFYWLSFHLRRPPTVSLATLILLSVFNVWVRLLTFTRYIHGPLYLSGISLSTHLYLGLEIFRRCAWTYLRIVTRIVPAEHYISLADHTYDLMDQLERSEGSTILLESKIYASTDCISDVLLTETPGNHIVGQSTLQSCPDLAT